MKNIGIYIIRNIKNNKIYIGQSIELDKRWETHQKSLCSGSKKCNPILLNEWNKYGYESFEFIILEECEFENLTEREKYYMEVYNSLNRNFGYNIREAGNHGKLPEYLKKQISEKVKLERKLNPEKYSGESNGFYGKKHSEKTLKRMSEIKKGKIRSKETIEKAAISNRNKKLNGTVSSEANIEMTLEIVLLGKTKTAEEISKQFNVKISTVNAIRSGFYWTGRYLIERDIDNENFQNWKKHIIRRKYFE